MNTNETPIRAGTIACSEMPQARFDNFGTGALSDTELLALVLQNGMPMADTLSRTSSLAPAVDSKSRSAVFCSEALT